MLAAWAGKQTVLAAWAGYEEEEIPDRSGRPDRISIGQCDTTLVQGPETDERDLSGGKSSIVGDGSPADRRSPAVLYDRSVFVICFPKIIPST